MTNLWKVHIRALLIATIECNFLPHNSSYIENETENFSLDIKKKKGCSISNGYKIRNVDGVIEVGDWEI